ncbi:galactose/methyl galactoside import ATP-binding protein MglA [Peptococcaceae bacterium CEB3]|nr:galactose/methyl galactoside import ATP-binding protein MglA [Peptococcaceae bacterium CEB3]
MKTVLEMKQVSKKFPGTYAVKTIDFDVFAGEVHALLGENGAGKSTLMKVIAGYFNDYTGEILVNGKTVQLHSPAMAKANGIQMIYQELSLAKPISIAENLLAGRLPTKGTWLLDRKTLIHESKKLLGRVGLGHIDPLVAVEEISQSEAELVEIAKALGNNPSILVMDEPTSALSKEEVDRLFGIINVLKKQGIGIVYISHHLPEISKIADRVTVMRDGEKVATKDITDVTTEALVEMMIGRAAGEMYRKRSSSIKEDVKLEVKKLSRRGFFHNIDFHVRRGEILGICGLSGAGRSELARSLVGIDPIDGGEIHLDGTEIQFRSMNRALAYGLAYLSESRKEQGLALRLSVGENILSASISRYSPKDGKEIVKKLIKDLQVNPAEDHRMIATLSGGNQQKVLLAKWMATEPKVLILDEPTRGVDIGSKMVIHQAVMEMANRGYSVILITSDLPELAGLSDRVIIMRNGHFIGEIDRVDCTEEELLLAANGKGEYVNAIRESR